MDYPDKRTNNNTITNIKSSIKSNRLIFKNMGWLVVMQIANYLIPLLLIRYIIDIVGIGYFGKITYAQNIIGYLTVIINFGFEYSATQEIALNRDNKKKLQSIFWSVIRFKSILLLLSFAVLTISIFSIDKFNGDKILYFYAWLINIGFVLFPSWFLQGVEDISKITTFNFAAKFVGALAIVLIIQNATQYPLYLLILSLSYILSSMIALYYVIKKYNLHTTATKYSKVITKGFPIFLNNIFGAIYSTIGLTMLLKFVSDYQIGIYSGAYKIIMAVLMIISFPISTAIFPTVSRRFQTSFDVGWRFYKKVFAGVSLLGIVCGLVIFLFAPFWIKILLGNGLQEVVPLLKTFALLPPLVLIASMLTIQGMYGLQLQKYAPYIGATVCLFSIIINYFLIHQIGIFGAIWAYIASEILEIVLVAIIIFVTYKNKTNNK